MAIRDDQFWASFLGIEPSDWNLPGISIRAHVGLIGYRGLWCFRHRDCVAVSAPAGWVSHLQSSLSDGEVNRVLEQAFLADLLGDEIERLIGPAYQGCLEPGAFRPSSTDNVRALEGEDGAALLQLRVQCGDENVRNSGVEKAMEHVGYFEGSTLLAVAGYRPWNETAGDPCILTHPDFHGRGYGTAVASAVVQRALNSGKLLLYQTLEANTGAVRIARKLGYEQYARHIAVGLRNTSPRLKHA